MTTKPFTIKQLIIGMIMLMVVMALTLASFVFIQQQTSSARESLTRDLETYSKIVADAVAPSLIFDNPRDAQNLLQAFHNKKALDAVWVLNSVGQVVASFEHDATLAKEPPVAASQAKIIDHPKSVRVVQPIVQKGRQVGTVVLQANLLAIDVLFWRSVTTAILVVVGLSLLLWMLATKFQSVISAPILQLADTARAIATDKDFSVRVHGRPTGELGDLFDGFNTMLEQLHLYEQDRNRAERQLADSQRQYQLVTDNIPVLLAYVDAELRHRFTNRGYRDWFRRDDHNMNEALIQTVMDEETFHAFRPHLTQALNGEKTEFEVRIPFRQGSFRWVRVTYVPDFNAQNQVQGIYVLIVDIETRKQAQEQAAKAHGELIELTKHLEMIQEEERRDIARELHDEFGQLLTAFKFDLSWIQRRLNSQVFGQTDQEVLLKIPVMIKHVDTLIQTIRRIATSLRPTILDDLGLIPSLEWLCNDYRTRTGCSVSFTSSPKIEQLSFDQKQAVTLFRAAQELFTNVIRHAEASHVSLEVEKVEAQVRLIFQDNGKGFSELSLQHTLSFGLRGLRERVSQVNGECFIKSEVGKGTSVTVQIPVLNPKKQLLAEETHSLAP